MAYLHSNKLSIKTSIALQVNKNQRIRKKKYVMSQILNGCAGFTVGEQASVVGRKMTCFCLAVSNKAILYPKYDMFLFSC